MEDGRPEEGALGTSVAEEWDYTKEVYDDLFGKSPGPSLVAAASAEEMEEHRKHIVYRKVPIPLCWERAGKKPSAREPGALPRQIGRRLHQATSGWTLRDVAQRPQRAPAVTGAAYGTESLWPVSGAKAPES